MKEVRVSLNSIDRVKMFINATQKYSEDIEVISGRYIIDGKSIMGIFSVDLSNPLNVEIHGDNKDEIYSFINDIKELVVDQDIPEADEMPEPEEPIEDGGETIS